MADEPGKGKNDPHPQNGKAHDEYLAGACLIPDVLSESMSELAQEYARKTGIAFGWAQADILKLQGQVRLFVGCEWCGYVAAATSVPLNIPETEDLKKAAMQKAAEVMGDVAPQHNCPHWDEYLEIRDLWGLRKRIS